MDKLYIPVVLGTARKGNNSSKVAKYLVSELKKNKEIKTKLLPVKKFMMDATTPVWQNKKAVEPWLSEVRVADAFIFVVPEYNHGYPGEFKIVLDQGFEDYFKKPCLVAGVSAGRFGGARVIENLIPVLYELGMVMAGSLNFGGVRDLFDKKGNIEDGEGWGRRVGKQVGALVEYAEALKPLREKK